MAIVLNPNKQQNKSVVETFCWTKLPELLHADNLFNPIKNRAHSLPAIISEDEDGDEDEDEDWDDDEEYEDEEYEDEEDETEDDGEEADDADDDE